MQSLLFTTLMLATISLYAADTAPTPIPSKSTSLSQEQPSATEQLTKELQFTIVQNQMPLDSSDINNISISQNPGDSMELVLALTPTGIKKLQQFSTDHLQQVLQVSLDDHILIQTTILSPLSGNTLGIIVTGVDENVVQALVKNFNNSKNA